MQTQMVGGPGAGRRDGQIAAICIYVSISPGRVARPRRLAASEGTGGGRMVQSSYWPEEEEEEEEEEGEGKKNQKKKITFCVLNFSAK